MREEPDRPLLQSVCAFVKSRKLLLILDNCKHVVKASADLASALLRAAPNVRVLASSREALRVPGEQIYPVLPMPVPPSGAAPSGPTINVSTTPMPIQPSSAAMTGTASFTIGRTASRTKEPRPDIRPSYGL